MHGLHKRKLEETEDERVLRELQLEEERNATKLRYATKMSELKAPWISFLDPHLGRDPSSVVIDYMIDDVCQVTEEPCYYPESKLPILLLFYGDHNIEPFIHFMNNIIADGDTKPLAKVLMKPIRVFFPRMRLHHLIKENFGRSEKQDEHIGASWTMLKEYHKRGHAVRWADRENEKHIMVKFTLGGQDYIACEAGGRDDYRFISDRACDTTHRGRLSVKWRCRHSVILGYCVRSISSLMTKDTFPMKMEEWAKYTQLHPGNWFEILYAMKLKRAPHSLWHALLAPLSDFSLS